jgi:hypothetical protein
MRGRSWVAAFAALLLAEAALAQEEPIISVAWCGYAHNVTGGGQANFTAKIFEGVDGAPMTLDAQWPDEGLYGRFLGANDFAYACEQGRLCMQFTGALSELEAGGYPEGTSVPMVIALDVADDGSGGEGAYRIESLPGFPAPQFGVLTIGQCEGV